MSSRNASSSSSLLLFVLAFLGVLAQLALGAPLETLEARDVYAPPVLYPHAGTVWYKGQTHNVTWDVSSPPVNITNKLGLIYLRKGGISTPPQNADRPRPPPAHARTVILADGFDILRGRIEVQVPWVFEGSDYSVVLMGDSGNWSQDFTIKQ